MKRLRKLFKQAIQFVIDNYLIFIFFLICLIVGIVILFKSIYSNEETIYVKVKVSQGLWWASTQKPSYWLVKSLRVGDVEKTLTRKFLAQIIERRAYPLGIGSAEQYETFLTVKLLVDHNPRTKKYIFKRYAVTVGAPIDFEFSGAQVSGTIYEISEKQFNDQYETRVVTVQKNFVTQFEYDGIQLGDKYFDGKDTVLEIIDKNFEYTHIDYSVLGNNYPVEIDRPRNIILTLKMKLVKEDDILFFREEFPLQIGRRLNFQTSSLYFDSYAIISIENK